MIGAPHDLPGIPVIVDIAAPGQRLEADAQAALGRALAQFAQVLGGAVDAAEREGRDVAAHQQEVGAELAHQVELLLGAPERFLALRSGHPLEIPERLQRADAKAEIAAHPRDVAGRTIEAGKIVLEDFDRIEAGCRDRLELLVERAANRNRCDRKFHAFAPAVGRRPINSEFAQGCATRPTWWCRSRRIRDRRESARTACRCRSGNRSPWRAPQRGTA